MITEKRYVEAVQIAMNTLTRNGYDTKPERVVELLGIVANMIGTPLKDMTEEQQLQFLKDLSNLKAYPKLRLVVDNTNTVKNKFWKKI